jgi:hypothetical protein
MNCGVVTGCPYRQWCAQCSRRYAEAHPLENLEDDILDLDEDDEDDVPEGMMWDRYHGWYMP